MTHSHPATRLASSESESESVKALLRADGGRVTAARMVVLQVLADAGEHLSVHEIHARVAQRAPSTNLSTVYRTVARLEELGLVHALALPGETQFGIVHRAHHHAVCTQCGAVTELSDEALGDLLVVLSELTGYSATPGVSLTVRGLCRNCQAKAG